MFVVRTKMPAEYEGGYDPTALDACELGTLGEHVLFVVYWYGSGHYEGVGHMLYSTDGMRWCDVDLGHCSCYGPMDGSSHGPPRTLEDLKEAYTVAAFRDVAPLFEAIRTHNWGEQ